MNDGKVSDAAPDVATPAGFDPESNPHVHLAPLTDTGLS
jgi:hypothetical protein